MSDPQPPIYRVNQDGARQPNPHDLEGNFVKLMKRYRLTWLYESWTIPLEGDKSLTPDFWLPELGVFVEIYSGMVVNKNGQFSYKRHRIRGASAKHGVTVVLIHQNNWPRGRRDFLRLVKRARAHAKLSHEKALALPSPR